MKLISDIETQNVSEATNFKGLQARHYAKNNRLVQEIVQEALNIIPDIFEDANTLLDIGCGTGENTRRIAQIIDADDVVGIDLNADFLAWAKKNELPKADFYQQDLSEVGWANFLGQRKFDVIFSALSLHWITDLHACLTETRKLMHQDSKMLNVVGIRPSANFMKTMQEVNGKAKWASLLKNAKKPQWQRDGKTIAQSWNQSNDPAQAFREEMESCGLRVDLCEQMKFSYTTTSAEECQGHLEWLVPHVRLIPRDLQEEYMADFMEAYSKHTTHDGKGHFVWENSILVVLASRDDSED